MKRTLSILGYTWAVLCIFIVLATFIKSTYFGPALASITGVKVSPWFSGGEVKTSISRDGYRTLIHRPVFDGLFSDRKEGFVQVNWEPTGGLPPMVTEEIDYDGDGRADFLVRLDTTRGVATLVPYKTSVISVEDVYRLKAGWAVRVTLVKGN
jgi:hypothetical protein